MTAAPALRNRIVGHGEESPTVLAANPKNWRSHPKAQPDAVDGALAEVGWVQQVLVNRVTGHLVDGHLRVELAARRGEATVPVTYVELSEKEEALVLATLDPLTAMAEVDSEKLRELLADLYTANEALLALLKDLEPRRLGSSSARAPSDTASAHAWT